MTITHYSNNHIIRTLLITYKYINNCYHHMNVSIYGLFQNNVTSILCQPEGQNSNPSEIMIFACIYSH